MDRLIQRPVLALDLGGTQIRAALMTPEVARTQPDDRIGDPAHRPGSHRSRTATASQGAPTS